MMENYKATILLGLTAVIGVVGLVLMFSSSQSPTAEVYFEVDGLGQTAECKDICAVLEEKTLAFKKQSDMYPNNKDFKKEFEFMASLEKTYKDYSLGVRRPDYRGKRECMLFYELAQLAGLKNVRPITDITFCCKK